ncbi:uncharacterized protein LOC112084003 [Eutrema salsugineum]|uniref:uncharacterized protein LOC112084003 n=1 Tax=Eutrema salsugineum TaxID=72664 RepID=UPI000CED21D3|nr:uncharacterized protein LOC112084003 [Eutrema salsugineum]
MVDLEHTCAYETKQDFHKQATSRIIASVLKSKYSDPASGPNASAVQQLVLQEQRVSASWMKCYRAKGQALATFRGHDQDSYLRLPAYLHMLKLANPNTVTALETDTDKDGSLRFRYVFVAFGASILGFRCLRRVLIVDGTHLWGNFKGVLLTVCGQDANFQVFPLAYAVVDAENEDAWTWFFMKVEHLLSDSSNLTIISDRADSIYTAKERVFPKAHHGACIVHLQRNVKSRFKNKGLATLLSNAAYAYRQGNFRDAFDKIRDCSPQCAAYLETIGHAHWSHYYFRGERFNIMTSNAAEQLNNALKKGRASPIVELLVFIQRMMSRWFCARRNKAAKWEGLSTPEVDKLITKHKAEGTLSKINHLSNGSCEVIGRLVEKNRVMVHDKKCSSTYKEVINPEGDPDDADLPQSIVDMVLLPPKSKRPSGRPTGKRIPSKGELRPNRIKKTVQNKCGRCHQSGHNRISCTNPL